MSDVEMMREDKIEVNGVLMRTIIKRSVYDRIKKFAQRYSTGRGNWDFGVGVEILLDWYEGSQLSELKDKLDLVIGSMNEPGKEPPEEEVFEEFLGGHKEKVEKGDNGE